MAYSMAKAPVFGDQNAYTGGWMQIIREALHRKSYEYCSLNTNDGSYSGFESAIRHHKE